MSFRRENPANLLLGVLDDPEILATVHGVRQAFHPGLLEPTVRDPQVNPGGREVPHGLHCLLGFDRVIWKYLSMLAGPVLL